MESVSRGWPTCVIFYLTSPHTMFHYFLLHAVYPRLCPLDASLPDDAMIPGLAMFTARAEPLATWMTGLEVAYFKVRSMQFVRFGRMLLGCSCLRRGNHELNVFLFFPVTLSTPISP